MTRALASAFVAVFLWLFIVPSVLSWAIPASMFFEVRRVYVADSVVGTSPAISVDREIKRRFHGTWEAVVRREEGSEFVDACVRRAPGSFDYVPGRVVPATADLDWWLSIPPNPGCKWEPGRYLVETTWRVYLWAGIVLTTRNLSNAFVITPDLATQFQETP